MTKTRGKGLNDVPDPFWVPYIRRMLFPVDRQYFIDCHLLGDSHFTYRTMDSRNVQPVSNVLFVR